MKDLAILVAVLAVVAIAWFVLRRKRSPEERTAREFQSWVIDTATRGVVYSPRDAVIGFVNAKRETEIRMRGAPITIAQLREQLYVLNCVALTSKDPDVEKARVEWASVLDAYDASPEEMKMLFKARDLAKQQTDKKG